MVHKIVNSYENSEEMKKATQVTLKKLCAVVAEWANSEEMQEIQE